MVSPMSNDTWRRCSSCKSPIGFTKTYWTCNVSTCNRKRTGLYFCSVPCWEAHLPMMRHRESWAVEQTSPTPEQWASEQAAEAPPRERKVVSSATLAEADDEVADDILIIASKLKKYIKSRSGMRTSDSCMVALSNIVRSACNEAIRRAGEDGRQTVLDRDFRHY
jgi:hypothetical protein